MPIDTVDSQYVLCNNTVMEASKTASEQTKGAKKPAPPKKKETAADREFRKAFTPNRFGEYA